MKNYNLLMLICCLLFSIGVYAQHNNSHSGRYNNGEIDFEFASELVYSDDDELLGVKVTVTNMGSSSINQDVLFRVHISTMIPDGSPENYNAEQLLILSRHPLPIGGSDDIFINLVDIHRSRVNKYDVITIWPVVASNPWE